MSHNVHTAPVPFKLSFDKVFDIELEEDPEDPNDDYEEAVSCLPQQIGRTKISTKLRELDKMVRYGMHDGKAPSVFGWTFTQGNLGPQQGKRYKWIIAYKLVKGKHVVWFVDESQYENVGYSTPSFIAFDKASIKALQTDIGGRIEANTVVMSWW